MTWRECAEILARVEQALRRVARAHQVAVPPNAPAPADERLVVVSFVNTDHTPHPGDLGAADPEDTSPLRAACQRWQWPFLRAQAQRGDCLDVWHDRRGQRKEAPIPLRVATPRGPGSLCQPPWRDCIGVVLDGEARVTFFRGKEARQVVPLEEQEIPEGASR